jgi:hypothetical protein
MKKTSNAKLISALVVGLGFPLAYFVARPGLVHAQTVVSTNTDVEGAESAAIQDAESRTSTEVKTEAQEEITEGSSRQDVENDKNTESTSKPHDSDKKSDSSSSDKGSESHTDNN